MAAECATKDNGDLQKKAPPPYSLLDCKIQLMLDFPFIYSHTISTILEFHNGWYTPTYNSLTAIMKDILKKHPDYGTKQKPKTVCYVRYGIKNDKGDSAIFNIHTMLTARPCVRKKSSPLPLRQEMALIKEQSKVSDEEADRQVAMSLLEKDYMETGQLIECACCFGNCVFDNMAQCMEGHLVCVHCLNAYAKESAYGAGKVALGCMASDCTAAYPQDELKRCLSAVTWKRLEERALKENLNMAEVKDLVRCPHCDYAAILSPQVKLFHCYRDGCQKETCRSCGIDWTEHGEVPCSQVETKDETSLRKKFEERMTKAKVRTCITCKTEFTKEIGCNKMTCRCGTTMCYICRTPMVTYAHFCQHPLDPGKKCKMCTACSLWTNPEADEERAIDEIRKEAEFKCETLGFYGEKQIGAVSSSKGSKTGLKK